MFNPPRNILNRASKSKTLIKLDQHFERTYADLPKEKNKVVTFVLTGGPSAGKSSVLQFINNYIAKLNKDKQFTDDKILVLNINETATSLMNQGFNFFHSYLIKDDTTRKDVPPELYLEFQKAILTNQIDIENLVFKYAENLSPFYKKVIIILDRGFVDCKAYIKDDKVWADLLDGMRINQHERLNMYNHVIFLSSAATGSGYFYTTANNAARRETTKEAGELDLDTLKAWYYLIKNSRSKLNVINYIDNNEGMICKNGKAILVLKYILKSIGLKYNEIFLENNLDQIEAIMEGKVEVKVEAKDQS